MSNIVKQGQSFLDKVVELTGSFENALSMAIANDLSITANLNIGSVLLTTEITNRRVVSTFNKYNTPSTALSNEEIVAIESPGIGLMVIENTFKVG